MFELETNIPIGGVWAKNKDKYPFKFMAVGDSFWVDPGKVASIRGTAQYYAKKMGWKFSIYKQPDGAYRCWRTA